MFYLAGDSVAALQTAEKAVKLDSASGYARRVLAQIKLWEAKSIENETDEDVLSQFNEAVSLEAEIVSKSQSLAARAEYYGYVKNDEAEYNDLQEALRLCSRNGAAWYMLEKHFQKTGKIEKAEQCRKRVEALEPFVPNL